jgi:nucleotide-binding universal stress UspA family protein
VDDWILSESTAQEAAMFNTILVPLDGTRFAEAAIPVAVSLARNTHGGVRAVMAHVPESVLVGVGEMPIWSLPERPDHRPTEQAYLAEIAIRFSTGGTVLNAELIEGEPGPALAERIAADPPDLIVMSAHGRGPFSRLWVGSVSDYLVRHVSVPILLVHPTEDLTADCACRRMLVPLDLSEDSGAVLEPARALARIFEAHLTLVHVLEPAFHTMAIAPGMPLPVPVDGQMMALDRELAQKRLDREADKLRSEGFRVATRVEVGATVASALLDLLDTDHYDVVAITTHGRGGWRRAMLGSVADKLLRNSSKPMLVLRPEPRHVPATVNGTGPIT